MPGNSRPVQSSQTDVHPDLAERVQRHLTRPWRRPLARHNLDAYALLAAWRRERGSERPVWLDSGCGTGRAAVTLALQHPERLVVGIDQSEQRLARGRIRFVPLPDNLLLLRAECADIWRLMQADGWHIERHLLLYPNPWPKPAHLLRRWQGHPVLPSLLAISASLELRTNWQPYAREMAQALVLAGWQARVAPLFPPQPLTDFEAKYQSSHHDLWQLLGSPN